MADPEVQKSAAALRAKYAGKKIIVGVDVCQRYVRVYLISCYVTSYDIMLLCYSAHICQ